MNATLPHWKHFQQGRHPELLDAYKEKGYLVFEDLLQPDEVQRTIDEFRSLLERFAKREAGVSEYKPPSGDGVGHGAQLQSASSEAFVQFENGVDLDFDDLDSLDNSVRKYMSYQDETDYFRYLLNEHPALRPMAERMLGEPVELYQSIALVKPARIGAPKAWHQDNAYFSLQDPSKVIGIWIALDDASPDNGCMYVLEGGHKLGPLRHVIKKDCEIDRGRIDKSQAKAVPTKAGSGLFFHGNLPHFTPPNRSDKRRRAIQFHFHGVSNKRIPKEDYMGIFQEADGTPATCDAARSRNL